MKRVVAICLVIVLLGCKSRTPPTPQGKPQVAEKPAVQPSPAALPVLAPATKFSLTDQTRGTFGSDQLLGRAWILSFFSTVDQGNGSKQVAHLAELQNALKDHKLWKDIFLVSVTTDPEHDTPEVLGEFADQAGADEAHWKFLTEGFQPPLEKDSSEEGAPLTAGPNLVLIDPQGDIRGYYDSSSSDDINQLKQDLDLVLQERLLIIDDLLDPEWLEGRRQAQMATVDKFQVFRDFTFTDRLPESGIRFRHRIVDDSGREHKACHYDHGNGVAVADVDGDGLLDVYFVNQVGANELWRNRGDGTFEDITEPAGVAAPDRIGVSASFADIDNDGDADLYVTNVRSPNVLLENDGAGHFTDISQSSRLDYEGHSSSAVFFDYNRDGLLDLFLVNVGVYTTPETAEVANDRFTGPDERRYSYQVAFPDAFAGHLKPERTEISRLYENQGNNRFLDVSSKVELLDASWSGDASPMDGNEDGWPDLYVLNMQGHDEYYENVKGERFVKKSRELFPATPWGAMGIKVFDFDNDGRLDIYITDMHTDMGEPVAPENEKQKVPKEQFPPEILNTDLNHVWGNAFFHRQPDGTYQEISDRIGAETYWPWGLSVGDLNADGFEDVFVTAGMNFPFRYAVNSVLLNNRGVEFLDSEFILGVEPRRGGRTAVPWFELDLAGRDQSIAEAYRAKGIETARLVAWGALGTRSSVIFDIENDGDLDIITGDFNTEPMVLVSNLTGQNDEVHFLKIRLEGVKSNRDGLGAVVVVHTGSQSYTKVHDGKSGYLSQSRCPLYFGLGEAGGVDRIEVRWPSGQTQVVADPGEINTLLEITEPES